MARIVVIGGHGKVALQLERLLTERGDEVDAIIRNPEHRGDVEATGATAVVVEVRKSPAATRALPEIAASNRALQLQLRLVLYSSQLQISSNLPILTFLDYRRFHPPQCLCG